MTSPQKAAAARWTPAISASRNRDGAPMGWDLFGAFETEVERDAYAARFPKAARVKRGGLSTFEADWRGVLPTIHASGRLLSDRVNGGVNEAGLRRYRAVVAAVPDLRWKTSYANSYPTREAFEQAIEKGG